jgi:hypothetical protein
MQIALARLRLIRTFLELELEISQSTIPLDVFLIVLDHFLTETPLSLKVLFVECKHSQTGIRYHLKSLFENNWLVKVRSNDDKRIYNILPGTKLLDALSHMRSYEIERA